MSEILIIFIIEIFIKNKFKEFMNIYLRNLLYICKKCYDNFKSQITCKYLMNIC
jgi:hypothetical protein